MNRKQLNNALHIELLNLERTKKLCEGRATQSNCYNAALDIIV